MLTFWDNVADGEAWMPVERPAPYQPPQPDTSLAASIERAKKNCIQTLQLEADSLLIDDLDRIIEAARKWDEHISNAAAQANDDLLVKGIAAMTRDTDPDGVGEGWVEELVRLCEILRHHLQEASTMFDADNLTQQARMRLWEKCVRDTKQHLAKRGE